MSNALLRRHQDIRRLRECRQKEGRIQRFHEEMEAIFSDRTVSLEDFAIRPLFEALVDDGFEMVQNHFGPNRGGGFRLQEADGAVSTKLFANTMGQYIYNATLRAYEMPELVGMKLCTKQSTNESGEKIPGVSELADDVEVVGEGNPYPTANVAENWIQTPETIKRGLIVNVTKEAVFFDKTNLILRRAGNVGRTIAINKEKRILDVVVGTATVYSRNGGAPEATYQAENTLTTTPLVDYTSLDAADTKFMAITDPDTGEPIVTTASSFFGPPALRNTAMRIRNAFMTNAVNSGRETRVGSNSLNNPVGEYIYNQYLKLRIGNDTTWFYGNPQEAFVYSENWPLTVETVGADGELAFERDIVARFKASERGAAGVLERRYVMKCTA